jgi:O-antigen/teichoic acid export membrane protein
VPESVVVPESTLKDTTISPLSGASSTDGHSANGSSGSPSAQVATAGVWGLSGRAALLIANLLATPFIIRMLGPSSYGLWALLQTSLTWAVVSSVGMGFASTKFGSDYYARGDDSGESAVVWTSLGVSLVSTTVIAALIAFGAPFLLSQLLHVQGDLLSAGIIALRLFCAIFVVQAVMSVVNTPQVVRLQWGWYTVTKTGALLIATIGAPALVALLSGGIVTASVVWLGATVLGTVGMLMLAVRLQPSLRRPRFDNTILRQLLRYGGALTISGLAVIPLSTAERFFLARDHSTAVVAYYAVAATLATTLIVLPEQLVGPLRPGLARLQAEGRHDEHRALYRKSLAGLFLVLTPAAIILAFLAHPFLSVWAGPEYGLHSTGPFMIIIAGVWLNCLAYVPYSYLLASGRTSLIAYIQTAEVVPYIAGAWLLTAKFGATGAAVVWSATFAVDAVVFLVVVWRVARLPFSPLSSRRLRSALAPVALGCIVAATATITHGLVERAVLAAFFGLGYFLAVWRLVLTTGERESLVGLVGQMVRRRGPRTAHALRAM